MPKQQRGRGGRGPARRTPVSIFGGGALAVILIGEGDAAKSGCQAAIAAYIRQPKDPAVLATLVQSVKMINAWRTHAGDFLLGRPFRAGTKDYVLTQDGDLVTPQLEKLREVFRDLDSGSILDRCDGRN